MAKLAWVHLCERAFLDNTDRLCVVGVVNRLPVPRLPVNVYQLMLAGHVVDVQPGEEFDIGVSIATPSGLCRPPDDPACLEISIEGEYVLATLRQFPLDEEGMYQFSMSIGEGAALTVEIPVLLVSRAAHAPVH